MEVLVLDGKIIFQAQVAASLEQACRRVRLASSAREAEDALRASLPDLLILDLTLPGESGISFIRRLRASARTRELAILVLTDRSLEEDKLLAFEAGADDYLTKPFSGKELVARVNAVLRRNTISGVEASIEIAGLRVEPATRRASVDDRTVPMTLMEFRLLHFLMSNPGLVYTRAQLLENVWGASIEERSVDVHIRRLRRALGPTGHDRLIRTVRGSGYILSGLDGRAGQP